MPSGGRQIKFPLTFPPIEAQPVRASAAGRIRSGEARMSSAPVAIDGKSAAALQPKEEQRFAAKCRAEDQHHADRQGFDQRKEQRVTTRRPEFGQSGAGDNRPPRAAPKNKGKKNG